MNEALSNPYQDADAHCLSPCLGSQQSQCHPEDDVGAHRDGWCKSPQRQRTEGLRQDIADVEKGKHLSPLGAYRFNLFFIPAI